jgi:hypothetical protein
MSLPSRCSYRQKNSYCHIPPSHVVSMKESGDEFLLGVYCERHKKEVESRLILAKQSGSIKEGSVRIEKLKSVSTECFRACVTSETTIERPLSLNYGLDLDEGEDS